MRKKFAGNLLLLIFANVLVKPFWIFGIDRVVQNRVGAEEYGSYFALFNFSILFSIVLDFGINNFNNRAIARHPARLASYFPNLMVIKLALAAIYVMVAVVSAFITGYSGVYIKMLLALAVNQVLLSYILYLRSNLTALHLFRIDSAISVLDRLLAILLCAVLLYSSFVPVAAFKIEYFIWAQTIALLLTALVALVFLRGRQSYQLRLWRWKFIRAILLKSAPFALLGLLMTVYYRIDAIMLERMYSAEETGIYAKSYRLLDAINQFGYLFGVPLMPLFASMIRKREDVQDLLRFSAILMFLFSTCAAILCSFFGTNIMTLLYADADSYSIEIFSLLMISFIPISSVYIFGTLLTAHGSLKVLNAIAMGGIVVNVVLNLLLIPGYGALGTTIATIFTQVVVAALHIMVANRTFKVQWQWLLLLKLVGFVVFAILISWGLTNIQMQWMIKLMLNGVLLLVVILLLQLIPIRQLQFITARKG
jgi:O-antigen/teichoic acid export membrane protein